MYIAGIDGGGTKTHCVIGDRSGNILSEGFSSGANYQTAGIENARASISASLNEAAGKLGIDASDLDFIYLGLSGADMECDFKILNNMCGELLAPVPFKVVNDCWIALRAGTKENYGIVTVCGTGTNTAGRTRDGREVILRSLSYELGNRGGGIDIMRDALHFAFRSEECTGTKTRLEHILPGSLGYGSIKDMIEPIRNRQYDPAKIYYVPPLVFRLASEGDRICQDILVNMGRTIGEMACGVIIRLGVQNEEIPVALAGGLLKGDNPLLVDEYTTTVHRTAPHARVEISKLEPAVGAYLLGLEEI